MKYRSTLIFLSLLVISTANDLSNDWESKCNKCRCHWKSSKKTADCKDTNQASIPTDLHTDIQSLDLSNNRIAEIRKKEMSNNNLHNLHKLIIANSTLELVDTEAFEGLSILIELDLSNNDIKVIHAGTFHPLIKIRKILLHDNQLTAISDRTFENLMHLSHVELNNNRIHSIGDQAFVNVPLKTIYLGNNRLQQLNVVTFNNLLHLSALTLDGNMWNCTCELKEFRNFVIDKKLTLETKCHYPDKMRGKLWTDVDEDDFACKPRILLRGSSRPHLKASKENETITCIVNANPRPNVEWIFNRRSLRESDRYKIHTYEPIASMRTDILHVVNSELTIVGLRSSDAGKYVCRAFNAGGDDQFEYTLEIPAEYTKAGAFVPASSNTFFMILCIIVGVLFIILFTIVILCCYCRRENTSKYHHNNKNPSSDNTLLMTQTNGQTTKLNGKTQSDSILDSGSVIMEMQKSLLTEVNPVEKPPRRTDVDTIEKDGDDDISEMKQTLLFDETIVLQNDDETRSIQLSDSTQPRSRQAFIDDGFGVTLLPPDLLAFPRFPQSPSIQSSISNIHDARIYGRSPLTSPVYGETTTTIPNNSGFRTLQHPKTGRTIALATTRSNSPFIPAPILYPPIMKQGYVTIPRKPRTGSWAPAVVSELSSPNSPTTTIEIVEPVYDNLGVRTTATGSSSLNLNKIPASSGKNLISPGANIKYSMKDRPLPATPNSLLGDVNGDQSSVINANGSLREPLYSERKVPPRPPPKPKKNTETVTSTSQRITSNGHFEDECEDGTEV
ncbi:hypothetical protein PVAND_000016 [Polypedilum vanderplanki]|uniref:Ig-like domain-containing protein n=1 Tax=Polypedilum vanderplanki TaxID=319348 RepID=A0A9J6BIJ8_POLVA|nr:hypothetical protein PVAND_000016 [Polypedilum vanderplanki]